MFNIFNLDTGDTWKNVEGEPVMFETGKEAADYCKTLPLHRLQPRKAVKGDDNWRRRESGRIADGTYKRPEYLNQLERNADHFLHLAEKKPGQLAYTKDALKGSLDLQSVISLQGYIEQFASDMPAEQLDAIRAAHMGRTLDDDGLKFATTPDEIVWVYTNYDSSVTALANSCMRYRREDFSDDQDVPPHHPCYVYGAGDLAVAYMVNDDGETTARALCWPEKKIYTRVYDSLYGRLHDLLKARGYQKSGAYYPDEDNRGLEGARLLRIKWDGDGDIFLVPYCDDVDGARDDGRHLILEPDGRVDMRINSAWSGSTVPEEDDRQYCAHCEEHVDDEYLTEVHVSDTRRYATYGWCRRCRIDDAFYCDHTEEYYSSSHCNPVQMADGSTWSQRAFEDNGGTCARTDVNYPSEELDEVIVDDAGSTELWGPRARRRETWTCDRTGELVSDDVGAAYVTVDGGCVEAWAPHVATAYAQSNAVVVYEPRKLTLTGDDPGQLCLPLWSCDPFATCHAMSLGVAA